MWKTATLVIVALLAALAGPSAAQVELPGGPDPVPIRPDAPPAPAPIPTPPPAPAPAAPAPAAAESDAPADATPTDPEPAGPSPQELAAERRRQQVLQRRRDDRAVAAAAAGVARSASAQRERLARLAARAAEIQRKAQIADLRRASLEDEGSSSATRLGLFAILLVVGIAVVAWITWGVWQGRADRWRRAGSA